MLRKFIGLDHILTARLRRMRSHLRYWLCHSTHCGLGGESRKTLDSRQRWGESFGPTEITHDYTHTSLLELTLRRSDR
jgi:hypothetical protein